MQRDLPLRVLAIGSSSTVGVGATTPDRSYPARLAALLGERFGGRDIEVIARGLSGDVAENMARRLALEVATVRPHLVLWQVGTNAAVARLPVSRISRVIDNTTRWLVRNDIDVALIDPQFTSRLGQDEHYRAVVGAIAAVAKQNGVTLIRRFDAMSDLADPDKPFRFLAADRFHLNDLGYRCLALYVSRAMVRGVLRADRLKPAAASN